MRILILGGDGYLGWPTAMDMAQRGHEVMAVDNYLRRSITRQHDVEPLNEVPNLSRRTTLWASMGNKPIQYRIGDLNQWEFVARVFADFVPEAIIHYAEQPSAPFSMLDRQSAALTLQNNLGVTFNIIFAMRDYCPDAHLIKLGTMGEYGTPNIDIEEGWLEIDHKGRSDRFLYPRQAGSLYHTTKIFDTDLLWFYVRMWDLRVTDLMQGPVYGIYTDACRGQPDLLPFFAYDELFGTVLNRFVVQAVAGHPLTVYGAGGQRRGFLNIEDTLQCVALAADHPADKGDLRIFNQFTETFSVNELAERISGVAGRLGFDVEINHLPNPRVEKEEHYYNPAHTGLAELGLRPHLLDDDVLAEMIEFVAARSARIDPDKIFRRVGWR